MKPEGTVDDSDQDGGMPEDQEEDATACFPADIFRSKTEDLGGEINER